MSLLCSPAPVVLKHHHHQSQSALEMRGTESIPLCKETGWLELAIFSVSIQHVEAAKNIPARNKALLTKNKTKNNFR